MAGKPVGEQRFGRYRLVEMLGEGGMAVVYRAMVDGPEGFARQVVLKRVLPKLASNPKFVSMFLAEARLCAMLHHPSIVQVHDLGEIGGDYFLAMEYVDGLDLATVLARAAREKRAMPPGVACQLALQIADALAYAHALTDAEQRPLHIVHRDVSPSNIMITSQGVAKLLDFGIAKVASHAAIDHTRTGTLKGKVSYMSPEQAEGLEVDQRTDIFALGIVLWECLTGERLFGGAGDEMETLRRVREAKIWPPSSVRPDIEPDVDTVVLKMLAKTPEARYQSAADAVAALRPVALRHQADASSLREFVASLASAATPAPDHTTPARRKTPKSDEPKLDAAKPDAAKLDAAKPDEPKPAPANERLPAPAAPPPTPARFRPFIIGSITLLMLGGGALALYHRPTGKAIATPAARKPRAPGPLRLAIVQFKNQGNDSDLAFLSEGIGDTLSVKLAPLSGKLTLIERNQIAQAMKEIEFGRTDWADPKTAIELGRITGAEVVVLGGFQRASGKLRAVARFVSTDNGEVLDARSADSAADAPFELQDTIAEQVRLAAAALAAQGK